MDWLNAKETFFQVIRKNRYLVLVLLAGILFMLIPEKEDPKQTSAVPQQVDNYDLQTALQQTLSLVQGAGKVAVLLTERQGEEILYQTDDDQTEGEYSTSITRRTLTITDENRREKGMVRQINPPVLQGAVIICQGAGDPSVKLAIVEAVMRATGLPSSSICVLKMK